MQELCKAQEVSSTHHTLSLKSASFSVYSVYSVVNFQEIAPSAFAPATPAPSGSSSISAPSRTTAANSNVPATSQQQDADLTSVHSEV